MQHFVNINRQNMIFKVTHLVICNIKFYKRKEEVDTAIFYEKIMEALICGRN
jgi:hypothetical protein